MSLRKKFTGTGIAIVTPFHADGKIDWESFANLIEFWIKGKVEYLVAIGTTGESATIHGAEKQEVFSFVQNVVAGRVPLVAGIGGGDTNEVLGWFKQFDLTGYDAILSVSPAYNKPNQEGIFQHYKALDKATQLPIIMYNVPSRTGQNVSGETTIRIANECKNIFATKEACGNFDQINYIIKNKPADFMVISGDDPITLPMIACGAEGLISVVANAYPEDYSNMVRLCIAGKFDEAKSIHYKYTDIITSMFAEGSPSGVKAYLSEMGLCKNTFRLPVWPVSEGHYEKIKGLMK
ncbi:MAG: 4-hydroxy-tetrahydrodipicolinate synthase [Chitinophagaceae bacterium]|nr:4-hydroxy-tetrahydrodipicolinate synthase [Chitinophagaceae bacterium]MBP6478239.1 4-hydroxy-tetrahydrodipicolinate synthase [Chitinophagaceae bacterium]MBP7109631.1 4-hydroxy-tetrahydrodipicolinate synthase [Chitinophagaceae bacterium]MBP7315709.1 4-hydroxy-tetrahydrodipicolinate synthase [Chitinophagaceae bacterium]HQV55557.1 4-hydroxy-tetrahydrodipicolinate synthase [Chitinophagaceae bacterium]